MENTMIKWHANKNIPGKFPESNDVVFLTHEEARDYHIRELQSQGELEAAEAFRAGKNPVRAGEYIYWYIRGGDELVAGAAL